VAKSTNFNRDALKGSFTFNNTGGFHNVINGFSPTHQTEANSGKSKLAFKTHDNRNPRTGSAVEKLRISSNSNSHHYQELMSKGVKDDQSLRLSQDKQSRKKGRSTSNYTYKKTKVKGNSSNRGMPSRNNIWNGLRNRQKVPSTNNLSSRPFSNDFSHLDTPQSHLAKNSSHNLELSSSDVEIQLQNKRFTNLIDQSKRKRTNLLSK
jgi:hypothetical protein